MTNTSFKECLNYKIVFFKIEYGDNVARCTLSLHAQFKDDKKKYETVTWAMPLLDVEKNSSSIHDLFSIQIFSRLAVDPRYVSYA
jgi:hypothetical protein